MPKSSPQSLPVQSTNRKAMTVATSLFFMWGFLTSLNDVLIPNLKSIFDLNFTRAMLVQFAFFSSYFIFAIPAGLLVERLGYKRTMVVGLSTMTAGALLFIPAARIPAFWLFMGGLVVLAAGITALQVAANPYVANLGPQTSAASRLNLAQAFNSFGTFLAPIFGAFAVLSRLPPASITRQLMGEALRVARARQASSIELPYLEIAATLAILAIALAMIRLPTSTFPPDRRPRSIASGIEGRLRHHPQLLLATIGIFLYVGAEVSIGSFLVNFFELPQIGNLSPKTAGVYVSLYWGGAMVGRFIGAALLRHVNANRALGIAATAAASLVAVAMITSGHAAMAAIIAVGLFNSIMFPTIFTLGLKDLGPMSSRGSSLLVCAIVGGAIIPILQGKIADGALGLHHAFVLPVACYLYIAAFGFSRSDLSEGTPLAEKAS